MCSIFSDLQIVEELSYENEYLRNTCTEQEAQVRCVQLFLFLSEIDVQYPILTD